jgi:ATP-binding protein involved in chromosome partitioning
LHNLTDTPDNLTSDAAANLVLTSARAGLVVASQHEESGLFNKEHKDTRARVLEVRVGASGGLQVHVDSSGLNLGQKLFIERVLLRHLDHENLTGVSIYFRKASRATAGAQPAPVARKTPYGIAINKKNIPGTKNIIAVASGKGGVGKSTISSNLAAGLAKQGLKVGLMDCDVYGPSAQLMFGLTGTLDVRNGKLVPQERHGVKIVSFGLLSDAKSPVIWRGPMVSKAIEQLCYDVLWGDLDVLVLDLPPGTGDVQLTLAERIPLRGSVIVTTPQDVALIDAHKAISMFETLGVPVLGVVQNMASHSCSACGHIDDIFGGDAFESFLNDRKIPCIASIPISRDIRLASDSGTPLVLQENSFAELLSELIKTVSDKLSHQEITDDHSESPRQSLSDNVSTGDLVT